MINTGRIKNGIDPRIREIVFGKDSSPSVESYLQFSCKADKAHLIMLFQCGLLDGKRISKILRAINLLEKSGFRELRSRSQQRGIFSLYEDYLIEKHGVNTGGILQYARSRNDLNATVLILRFRQIYLETYSRVINLLNSLYETSLRYENVIMPAYTHFQPAVPITYGHWLLGILFNLERSLHKLQAVEREIAICPLGACSVGGTTIPINTKITAELLGFNTPHINSVDAVSSRTWVLGYLSGIAEISSTLSRVANELLIFCTTEFNFFTLPDSIVGSSSLMPNKRNPFILEHITGKCGSVYGSLTAALSAMHSTLFSNSISVSQEATSGIWSAAESVNQSLELLVLFLINAKPNETEMMKSNIKGNTKATELANQLVNSKEISFRKAHKQIGAIITDLESNNKRGDEINDQRDEYSKIVTGSNYGGGPGKKSVKNQFKVANKKIGGSQNYIMQIKGKWEKAMKNLEFKTLKIIKEYAKYS